MTVFTRISIVVALLGLVGSVAGAAGFEQPWQRQYKGDDATGKDVVALWSFDGDNPGADVSGNGHDLELRGKSRVVKDGRFASALETFYVDPDNRAKDAQGAQARRHAALSPRGAFTLEMWIKPKADTAEHAQHFLLDNKYYHYPKDLKRANTGYLLMLARTRDKRFQPKAYLGYGDDSAWYSGEPLELTPGTWMHLAFVYDGKGTGTFYLNGQKHGQTVHEGRAGIAQSSWALAIGDRYGSNFVGSSLLIDQVRISSTARSFTSGKLNLDVRMTGGRSTFVRMEQGVVAELTLVNETGHPVTAAELTLNLPGAKKTESIDALPAGTSKTLRLPVDTRVRPDRYTLSAKMKATVEGRQLTDTVEKDIVVVPRQLNDPMSVIMWGGGEPERLKAIGFSHRIFWMRQFDMQVYKTVEPVLEISPRVLGYREQIDANLAMGMRTVGTTGPCRSYARNKEIMNEIGRVDKRGKHYAGHAICASHPRLPDIMRKCGMSIAANFGDLPGLDGYLIHSEIRDGTELCYHEWDRNAFRAHAGFDIPNTLLSKRQTHYSRIPGFPVSRIVPEDFAELVYYRWFWKNGDGWNTLHSAVHHGLKTGPRKDVFTWFDPAVRVPSIWGSGGEVDVINQWTYTYPDPIKMGQSTDEMFAMAAGNPKQKVMKMTQLIWKRFQTAPANSKVKTKARWEIEQPDVVYYTLAPDHLSEAFWCKIARPVHGIQYHGVGALFPQKGGNYKTTTDESEKVLTRLLNDVVKPLGPMLKKVPDRPTDVALLESFTSQVFGGPAPWGWGHGWVADCHMVLQWAGLQPKVIYEEQLLRDGLDGTKLLVMPGCLVLTEPVAEAVRAFQRRGGLVVADGMLPASLVPDIVIDDYRRTKKADVDKQALLERARKLRNDLKDLYTWPIDSSNREVVLRSRRAGSTDYLFAINDHRTFGDYVGHHGLVMEKGLPAKTTVTVRTDGRHVYDLVQHKKVDHVKAAEGTLNFDVALPGGGGRLFMITESPIDRVTAGPARNVDASREGQKLLAVAVVDPDGNPVDGVMPLQVTLTDPAGRPAEPSGYWAAPGGRLVLPYDWAPNDRHGAWTLTVIELASGKSTTTTLNW